MSDSDSDSEVHGSSNGESDFEGFSAADVRKAAAASARGRRAARPSTSTAVPMDTDDSSDESPSDKSDTSTDEVRLYFIWTISSCLSRMKFPLLLSPYPRSAGGPNGQGQATERRRV